MEESSSSSTTPIDNFSGPGGKCTTTKRKNKDEDVIADASITTSEDSTLSRNTDKSAKATEEESNVSGGNSEKMDSVRTSSSEYSSERYNAITKEPTVDCNKEKKRKQVDWKADRSYF